MQRLGILALLGAAVGTIGVHSGPSAAPVGSPAIEGERDAVQLRGNPLWAIPLTALTATGERPVFSPSRRRPSPPPPPPVAAVPPPPAPVAAAPEQIPLTLLGTITSPKNGIAICFNQATSEVVRLRTGESFEGWILRDVRAREAVFQKDTESATLALPSPDEPQVASAPPPPPGAAPIRAPSATLPRPPISTAPPSGIWRDGDGNLIAPPKAR